MNTLENAIGIGAAGVSLPYFPLPIFAARIPAGFPSPADDYIDEKLDLNDLLIEHPLATFFFRVKGDSMTGAGINDNDILIVDRALEPISGKIVLALVLGEFTVKILHVGSSGVRLEPRNSGYKPIEISNPDDLQIWGVVSGVVRRC